MLIFNYIKEILLGVIGFIALYLFNRNKNLKEDNQTLKTNLTNQSKIVNIQERVLNETKDTQNLTSNERVKRLQQYQKTRINKNKSSRSS